VDLEVQGVFFPEKAVVPGRLAFPDRPAQFLEVAAGAKRLVPGAAQQHQPDPVVRQGLIQGPAQQADHLQVQGIENLGTIQDQGQQAGLALFQDRGFALSSHFLKESGVSFWFGF